MSDVIKEIFKGYEDAPWLEHKTEGPSEEALKRIPELFAEQEDYPMAPGNELSYLDDSTPEGMMREDIAAPHGLKFYHFEPKERKAGDDRVIYYVHGGGFMRGNEYWCRLNAIHQVQHLGLPVYACEYRYTPENKYPKGIDDVEWGWNYLTRELGVDPKRIIITGESAGGTYETALLVRLGRQGRALPSGMVVVSGFLDFSIESPSYRLNLGIDPMFTIDLKDTVPFYLDDPSIDHDPEVSPIYSDMKGWPPTIFFADDTEVFVSDALIAADRLHKLGIRTEAYITHGLIHVYMFEMPDVPESAVCYEKIREFFGI